MSPGNYYENPDRNRYYIWDRQQEDAAKIKGKWGIILWTGASGYVGVAGPMSYREALCRHIQAQKDNISLKTHFHNYCEVVKWTSKSSLERIGKKLYPPNEGF